MKNIIKSRKGKVGIVVVVVILGIIGFVMPDDSSYDDTAYSDSSYVEEDVSYEDVDATNENEEEVNSEEQEMIDKASGKYMLDYMIINGSIIEAEDYGFEDCYIKMKKDGTIKVITNPEEMDSAIFVPYRFSDDGYGHPYTKLIVNENYLVEYSIDIEEGGITIESGDMAMSYCK